MLLTQELVWFKSGVIAFIGSALFFAFSTWGLNEKAKWILKHQYGMGTIKGIWRTPEYENLQADLLKDYLNEHHLYTDEKLKLLIEGYENETRKNKYPVLLNSGIVISLSVPLWIQYVTFIFRSVTTLEEATRVLINGIIFVLIVIALIGFTKWFFGEFHEAFLFGEKAHRKTLIEKLQDARLRYRKEKAADNEIAPIANLRRIRGSSSPRILRTSRKKR
ncbi:hypothetical protein [Saccharibacillus sacchari]|uniref:Uncharacterized protein n=1 Tax=Saccharibacillus sacchari TaxID=456493 RepID=A0ACC6PAQ0_9BACL